MIRPLVRKLWLFDDMDFRGKIWISYAKSKETLDFVWKQWWSSIDLQWKSENFGKFCLFFFAELKKSQTKLLKSCGLYDISNALKSGHCHILSFTLILHHFEVGGRWNYRRFPEIDWEFHLPPTSKWWKIKVKLKMGQCPDFSALEMS